MVHELLAFKMFYVHSLSLFLCHSQRQNKTISGEMSFPYLIFSRTRSTSKFMPICRLLFRFLWLVNESVFLCFFFMFCLQNSLLHFLDRKIKNVGNICSCVYFHNEILVDEFSNWTESKWPI